MYVLMYYYVWQNRYLILKFNCRNTLLLNFKRQGSVSETKRFGNPRNGNGPL